MTRKFLIFFFLPIIEIVELNDRANYIIIDGERKIGRTTASRTIVPELIVDPSDPSLVFYDCPGFLDNRGVNGNTDIVINYLLKMVTSHLSGRFLIF